MRKDLHPKNKKKKHIETTEMACYITAKIFYMLSKKKNKLKLTT